MGTLIRRVLGTKELISGIESTAILSASASGSRRRILMDKYDKAKHIVDRVYETNQRTNGYINKGGNEMNQQIENNFKYHSPKEGQPEKYTNLREKAKELAYLIEETCPQSREKSVALTNLETAVMWANASIARNE
jgi:hypothetical protein